jgi:hypothetical protein
VVVVGLNNLRGDMLKKGLGEVILICSKGSVQRVEVGGCALLSLVDDLKDFPFMGFELGNLI